MYEANFITTFLEFLTKGPFPATYGKLATRQWVSEVLISVPNLNKAIQIDGADSLFYDMTRALGGQSATNRLALLYGDINGKKRVFMQNQDLNQEDKSSNLAARRMHRNVSLIYITPLYTYIQADVQHFSPTAYSRT